jgi:outer membrane receptor protein involved in Fe transport
MLGNNIRAISAFMRRRSRLGLLMATATAITLTPAVYADDQAQSGLLIGPSSDSGSISEIIITATKRNSTLLDTPLAITAITGAQLAAHGVNNITDIAQTTPGFVVVDAGPGSRRVVVRGIEGPGEPTVGTYYDETPLVGSSGTSSDAGSRSPELGFYDVERVEVLRGPQGTLFGAGSMSGTFRVITNKPKFNSFEASVDGGGSTIDGGGSGGSLMAMGNLPLVDNKLAARVVGIDSYSPGYIDNIVDGKNNVNAYQTTGGRVLVRYQATDDLTIDGAVYYLQSRGQQPEWFPGAGTWKVNTYLDMPLYDNNSLETLTAHWDLGFAELVLNGSLYDRAQFTANDLDGYYRRDLNSASTCKRLYNNGVACSPTVMSAFNNYVLSILPTDAAQPQNVHDWTNEARLTSTDANSPLKWTVGFFSEERRTYTVSDQWTGNAATGELLSPKIATSERTILSHLNEYAGFGEASYTAWDKLTLTFGMRGFLYTDENTGNTTLGLNLLGTTSGLPVTQTSSQTGEVYKFNASYQWSPSNMMYAEAAEGFRPGGVNQVIGLPQAFAPFQSDSLWDYEVGDKWELFNRKLYLDGDIYDIEWNNMQVSGTTSNGAFSFISNAGAARVTGVEANIVYDPFERLELEAQGSWQTSTLVQNQVNANVSAPGRAGNRLPFVPYLQGDISAQYKAPLTDGVTGILRADVNFVGDSYSSFTQPNQVHLPCYSLVNLRAGIEAPDGNWNSTFYVNNLTDRVALAWASISATTGFVPEYISRPPRTFGINFHKSF